MNFSVGETLRVDGDIYEVIGKVVYRNLEDGCMWVEYRLYSNSMRKEKWLSCDDTYHEYSISEVCRGVSTSGYHQVDGGVEERFIVIINFNIVPLFFCAVEINICKIIAILKS